MAAEQAEPADDSGDSSDESAATVSRRTLLQGLSVGAVGAAAFGAWPSGEDRVAAYGYGGPALLDVTTVLDSVTESEPNDDVSTATTVSTGTELSGSIVGDEVDWYVYDLPAGEAVTVRLTRPATDGVLGLVLYTPGESFLDSRFLGTDATEFTFTPSTAGGYFLQVVNVEAGEGEYTLTVRTTSQTTTEEPTTTQEPTTTTTTTTEEPTTTTTTTTKEPTTTTTTTTTVDDGQAPYGGSLWPIPGRIEAENYDTGGQGVAFADTDATNNGGAYRSDAVDIQATDDVDGGYNVAWIRDGEWLEYGVDVAAGTYDVDLRVASPFDTGAVRVLLDGVELGTTAVPNTGGWQTWTTATLADVAVDSGTDRTLRLELRGGSFNLNHVAFRATDSGLTTPTTTAVDDDFGDDFGDQGYGEYGYGGTIES